MPVSDGEDAYYKVLLLRILGCAEFSSKGATDIAIYGSLLHIFLDICLVNLLSNYVMLVHTVLGHGLAEKNSLSPAR